ncbi:MAG: hypothetical protein Q8Q09_27140 [Deltaproteobacteria bacterium]|nr:hypothetical protein [Deltaproteobacteria bacterium]
MLKTGEKTLAKIANKKHGAELSVGVRSLRKAQTSLTDALESMESSQRERSIARARAARDIADLMALFQLLRPVLRRRGSSLPSVPMNDSASLLFRGSAMRLSALMTLAAKAMHNSDGASVDDTVLKACRRMARKVTRSLEALALIETAARKQQRSLDRRLFAWEIAHARAKHPIAADPLPRVRSAKANETVARPGVRKVVVLEEARERVARSL